MVERFVMQWHLSENCNLKCRHCYQENHVPVQLPYESLEKIYIQFKELLQKLDMAGHINITGGEPLCNLHLFKILDLIKEDQENISFSILTNGVLIDQAMAERIKSYNPYYVQVSLKGGRKTNDYIRGKGTYKQIAKGIENLKRNDIFTSISFTATSLNYREFPRVVRYAQRYNVDNVWSDRYIPLGDNEDFSLVLSQKQTEEYLQIMCKEKERLERKKKNRIRVSMYRALQFQMTDDFAYGCTAGDTLLTVMENGDLVPCRRMPVVVGNVLKENMSDLYFNHPVLKDLRDSKIPEDCSECEHSEICHGGLKCLTYALYGDLNHKDIGCGL